MGMLLATGGSGVLAVPGVWVGAEALGVVAVLLVAGGGAGWYALAHGILTPLKTSAG